MSFTVSRNDLEVKTFGSAYGLHVNFGSIASYVVPVALLLSPSVAFVGAPLYEVSGSVAILIVAFLIINRDEVFCRGTVIFD